MLPDYKSLNHWISNFYGYGSWDARTWFISLEESGGDLPEEVYEKLTYFYAQHSPRSKDKLCDIRQLYQSVTARLEGSKGGKYANLFEYRFGKNALPHNGWKNLIAFEHGYSNRKLSPLLTYQQYSFLKPSEQREALIPLFPLPSPHNHAWYYSWLDMPQCGFLKSRDLYEAHVYPNRISTILKNIQTHQPECVLMYGMNNVNALKKSVQASFPDTKFKLVKARPLEIPQHHSADLSGTRMIITTQLPTLRHNRIETGFNWEEFGKVARSV